ncbi:ABC transporter ATP-binding protein [Actinomycetospora sp. OC33-EN08]|uniref:ABC transporter ATP-binding protein n=1 Tax=Actinomycetospora aurantiaca TaxID=3129233 RepID=A0ABU8MJT6_9PSEU
MSTVAHPGTGLVVDARDVRRRFGDREILRGIDLAVRPGEFVALLGASGSGKTTLLRILGGLDPGADGIARVPERVSVAFQEPRLLPWRRAWRNVAFGLTGADVRARATDALREVGLAHLAGQWPKTLSGGEAQRVALARALVRDPDLLLLDEPLAALDALTRLRMQRLVADLCARRGLAAVLVTHDVDEALTLADRAVVLRDGVLAHQVDIDLDRPRDPSGVAFGALRDELLRRLGVEIPAAEPPSATAPPTTEEPSP